MKTRHIVTLTLIVAVVVALAAIRAARRGDRFAPSADGAVPTSGLSADVPFGAQAFRAIAAAQMPIW